jgi:2-oxoglutarate dehydrogenase E2 component (dihydrolipoamide succinyltransferase)
MNLCMSWDHRAFDGSSAMRFLSEVRAQLQDRDWESELRPGQ